MMTSDHRNWTWLSGTSKSDRGKGAKDKERGRGWSRVKGFKGLGFLCESQKGTGKRDIGKETGNADKEKA